MESQPEYKIGLVIYPDMTQLDITAPHQVFSSMPNTQVLLLWKTLEPVVSNGGLRILPTTTLDDCPQLDVVCVPGGVFGTVNMMQDTEILGFLQEQAQMVKYVTAVCTGSLILAAAGLLKGYRAATHWAFREQLKLMGAEVCNERVVVDGNRITGGGVTAGIDFALIIAAMLCGESSAKFLELMLEYNPAPPFGVGSLDKADSNLVQTVLKVAQPLIQATNVVSQQIGIL